MNNLLKSRTTVTVKQYTYSSMGLLATKTYYATFKCGAEQTLYERNAASH